MLMDVWSILDWFSNGLELIFGCKLASKRLCDEDRKSNLYTEDKNEAHLQKNEAQAGKMQLQGGPRESQNPPPPAVRVTNLPPNPLYI